MELYEANKGMKSHAQAFNQKWRPPDVGLIEGDGDNAISFVITPSHLGNVPDSRPKTAS